MSAKVRRLTLRQWIDEVGVREVAKLLKVDPSNVHHWRRGHCLPISKQMARILQFSKGAVDFNSEMIRFHKKSA